jgi:hypothetical protein
MDRSSVIVSFAVMVFAAQTPDASGTLVCITQPYGPPLPGVTATANACRGTLVVYSKIR